MTEFNNSVLNILLYTIEPTIDNEKDRKRTEIINEDID